METSWPRSAPTAESAEFWAGANRRELRLQRCRHCGRHQHYPRVMCSHCQATDLEWVTASGRGTVYSHTTVHRAPSQLFRSYVPYALALVDLDEQVRMLTWVVGGDPDEVQIGDRVEVTFLEAEDGFLLPVFQRVG